MDKNRGESKKQKVSMVSSVKKAFLNKDFDSRTESLDLRKKCKRSRDNFTNSSKSYVNK